MKNKEDVVEDYKAIENTEVYKYNKRAIAKIDKDDLKVLKKSGTIVKCSKCELLRYSVYTICPECGHKEE